MSPRLHAPIEIQATCVWNTASNSTWRQASSPVYYGHALRANEFFGYKRFIFVYRFPRRERVELWQNKRDDEQLKTGGVTCRTLVNSSAVCEGVALKGTSLAS